MQAHGNKVFLKARAVVEENQRNMCTTEVKHEEEERGKRRQVQAVDSKQKEDRGRGV